MSRTSAAVLVLLVTVRPAPAQIPNPPAIDGYYLNVGLWSDDNPITSGGLTDFQRLRLMSAPRLGPVRLEIAYEHRLTWTEEAGTGAFGTVFADVAPAGGEWLDLQWTPSRSRHWVWGHRFDRLSLDVAPTSWLQATIGRQPISWATTLLLTPADPFAPFDPTDPFREYRAGVDALRLRTFTGPFSEIELVVRPSDTPVGTTVTGLARGRTLLLGWEVSGWAGLVHDDPGAGIGLSGAVGSAAVRLEATLREAEDQGDAVPRFTIGVDRRLTLLDRDLYVILEYQRDEFGAADADELLAVATSAPLARGELQVLGRDVAAASAAFQIHPLWAADLLLLWNLGDASALLAPALSHSLSDDATARGGLFWGFGRETRATGLPGSEFGLVPGIVYLSATIFF